MQHGKENKTEVVAGGHSVMTFWRWLKLLIFRCNDCIDVCCYERGCYWNTHNQKIWGNR
jgi:epoxyqueuosine reductase QueG